MEELRIIGGGISGCEAAWQAAQRGIRCTLFEMRPQVMTEAHSSGSLAELVCSNSLGTKIIERPSGLLYNELKLLGSLLVDCAEKTSLPAGTALAVDRLAFSQLVTEKIYSHPLITVITKEITDIPPKGPCIIATGPLTSPAFSNSISTLFNSKNLFFFDAIAPIVTADSIDINISFRGSRFQKGANTLGDYINCPFNKKQYGLFVEELINAKRTEINPANFQYNSGINSKKNDYFEGCLPIEILASRSLKALAFGPMRPVGLINPRTGRGPYAVVQLRQDNLSGSLYNMVGFQTNLLYSEQKRIFQTIPGLESAEFVRFGQMHKNTYILAPSILEQTMQTKDYPSLFIAGQLAGIEGYLGNIGSGLLAGWNAARWIKKEPLIKLPGTTTLGALCYYISHADPKVFQPMKANLGILDPLLPSSSSKKEKNQSLATRSIDELTRYINRVGLN